MLVTVFHPTYGTAPTACWAGQAHRRAQRHEGHVRVNHPHAGYSFANWLAGVAKDWVGSFTRSGQSGKGH